VFSFVKGEVQSAHELPWIMFPGRCVVCGTRTHLLGLKFHMGGVGSSQWNACGIPKGDAYWDCAGLSPVLGVSQRDVCRLSMGYGSNMLQSPVQFELQFSSVFCFLQRKKKEVKNNQRLFPRQMHPSPMLGLPCC
jgi:hypothetical protein